MSSDKKDFMNKSIRISRKEYDNWITKEVHKFLNNGGRYEDDVINEMAKFIYHISEFASSQNKRAQWNHILNTLVDKRMVCGTNRTLEFPTVIHRHITDPELRDIEPAKCGLYAPGEPYLASLRYYDEQEEAEKRIQSRLKSKRKNVKLDNDIRMIE